ncbi:MAG: hypothetical protein ABIK53_04435 [bacterium]
MGKKIQEKDYVIVFNASQDTFEDMLFYFHCDLQEFLLENQDLSSILGDVIGVHADFLGKDLSFNRYFAIRDEKISLFSSKSSALPGIVHFLHFDAKNEIKTHRQLSSRFNTSAIKMVNPYNKGTSNCDSKFRMFEILKSKRIPTPEAKLISRFNKGKINSFKKILSGFSSGELYLQPDRGTEGKDCLFFKKSKCAKYTQSTEVVRFLNSINEDIIIRKKVGNLSYKGEDFVLRINVSFDGESFHANSGYAMVGEEVVSAEKGARRENINKVLDFLKLRDKDIERIKETSCDAVEEVFKDREPPLIVGVDVVLEQHRGLIPYVIDLNPRPVVVGSRIIGKNKINLGENFWKGVFIRCI